MHHAFGQFHPRLEPEQADVILATSNILGLWATCKRAACRRGGACCGFSGADIPPCVPRIMSGYRVCLNAIGALLPEPPAPPPQDSLPARLNRLNHRALGLIEQNFEERERQTARYLERRAEP